MMSTRRVVLWHADGDESFSECGLFSVHPRGSGYVLTVWLDKNIGSEYGSRSPFGDDGTVFETIDAAKDAADECAAQAVAIRDRSFEW